MRHLALITALTLSGCAASSYCTGEQDYQAAQSVPPIKGVEGAQLPESQSALRIPEPPANAVAYGEVVKDADGDEEPQCLDAPPRLATPPAPKPADDKPKS